MAPDTHESKATASAARMMDPILRNAVRYTISEREYDALRHFLRQRQIPPHLPNYNNLTRGNAEMGRRGGKKTNKDDDDDAAAAAAGGKRRRGKDERGKMDKHDDFSAAAVRASLRVFVGSSVALQLFDAITGLVLQRGKARRKTTSWLTTLRLPLSLSTILLLHRFLHRFLTRLRINLLTRDAAPFRQRNPRVSRALTSRLAPAVGASMAGLALGICPAEQLRITMTIYIATRSLEFLYNALEGDGWFDGKLPWWWGSWMMMPVACGQLLHAFVFDRDCFPSGPQAFILGNTPNYIQPRPPSYPAHLPWPSTNAIVDSLAEMSRLKWPPFISPILFPHAGRRSLPPTLQQIAPVTAPAHPRHTSLSCALLHPADPSCIRTLSNYILSAFPAMAKFFTLFYAVMSLPRYYRLLYPSKRTSPSEEETPPTIPSEVLRLFRRALRTTAFLTGAIGTSWSSICLFQALLPRSFLPKFRWFLGGFLGGLWAFIDRGAPAGTRAGLSASRHAHAGITPQVGYTVRMSLDSAYKIGVKRGHWRPHGWWGWGDVLVFTAGLALLQGTLELRPGAVSDKMLTRGLAFLRGTPAPVAVIAEDDSIVDKGKEKEKEK